MSAGTARRGSNFDLLRLAAASAVVFSHSLLVVAGEGWWGAHSTNVFRQFGDDAVAVFFVISGVLVTQSWLRDPHLVRYLTRRLLRVMPALVVTVAISCLVLGVIASELTPSSYLGAPGTWAYLINTTLFFQMFNLPGVFSHLPLPGAVNGSLWTLRYEFLCYLVVPVLVAVVTVLRRRGAVLIIGATCAAVATLSLTAHVDYVIAGADPLTIAGLPGAAGWNMAPLFVLLTYFLAGMSIEMWRSRIHFDARAATLAVPVFLVCSQFPQLFLLDVVALAYAVAYFGLVARPMFAGLVARGDASYGVYVWGFVVEQFIVLVFGPGLSPLLVFAIALPITWAIGLVSWRWIERPALRLKPRAPSRDADPARRLAVNAVQAA